MAWDLTNATLLHALTSLRTKAVNDRISLSMDDARANIDAWYQYHN